VNRGGSIGSVLSFFSSFPMKFSIPYLVKMGASQSSLGGRLPSSQLSSLIPYQVYQGTPDLVSKKSKTPATLAQPFLNSGSGRLSGFFGFSIAFGFLNIEKIPQLLTLSSLTFY
jgi:hypothetical protein